MSYYTTINGKKMDGQLIDQATKLVQGTGDGRISVKDAEVLMSFVKDGNKITDAEKVTVDYLFKNFDWTTAAEKWFRQEMLAFEADKEPVHMTPAELTTRHFATVDVFANPADQLARKHALEAASNETNVDHDEIELWIRLSDGKKVKVFSNFIELAGEFVELRGGCIVPIRAIEKVEV